MGLWHYFSKNEDKRALFIFNLIAPVYHLIDKGTKNNYIKMAALLNSYISLVGNSILDVGCGTGSWISALGAYKLRKSVGVDFSLKMLRQAEKNHPQTEFIHQHGEHLSAFADNSFNIVTASFVLHGMKSGKRALMLSEMRRVAKKLVVIHDFHGRSPLSVEVLERLERSDYVHFKKHFKDEMEAAFPAVEVLNDENGNALYIGHVDK